MNNQLTQAIAIYTTSRAIGRSKRAAKDDVYTQLPGFSQSVQVGESLAGEWGNAIRRYERARKAQAAEPTQPTIPGVDNGASSTSDSGRPTPSTNGYSPTDDILAYLRHDNPQPGDIITLNLHYLAWAHNKPNDAAWRYVFGPTGPLQRDGWRFEIVKAAGRNYQLRVTARPQPPAPAAPTPNGGPGLNPDELATLRALLAKLPL